MRSRGRTPSRTRVSISNSGTGALLPPAVALVTGSDPDFIVLHDQCESPLRAAEQCAVRLQLLPSKPGPSSATLGVDADGQAAQVSLTGNGLNAGPLRVVPAEGSSDFGGVLLGSTVDAFFDVLNPLPDDSGPITVALNNFVGQYGTEWNKMMAVATTIALPIVIIFIALQRFIVSGITSGATKE